MLKKHTFDKWLVLSTLLFLSMGCLPDPPDGGAPAALPVQGLTVEAVGLPTAGQCRVIVHLTEPGVDLDLSVHVEAEPVIRFMDTTIAQSKPTPITIGATEVRQIPFDCQLVPEAITLSGEYIVTAYAVHQSSGQRYQTAETKLHILVAENQTGPLLLSEQDFNQYFNNGFAAGGGNLQYQFVFDSPPYSTRGLLHLKVIGSHLNFTPEVIAWVRGGIQFEPGPGQSSNVAIVEPDRVRVHLRFPSIALTGSRIATVPFVMDTDSHVGIYSLEVMQNDGGVAWGEEAPIMFEVADAAVPGQHVLKEARMSEPRATEVVSIASFTGGSLPTAVPPTPPPPTPTPAATPAVPDSLPTTMPTPAPTATGSAAVIQAMNYTWEQRLTNYYGSCRDIYQQRIEGKLPMNWETFRAAVIYYNPDLANTDCMFNPFREYWLPTAATAATADVMR